MSSYGCTLHARRSAALAQSVDSSQPDAEWGLQEANGSPRGAQDHPLQASGSRVSQLLRHSIVALKEIKHVRPAHLLDPPMKQPPSWPVSASSPGCRFQPPCCPLTSLQTGTIHP